MRELTITADCGGSNNVRARLWKIELQKLADELQPFRKDKAANAFGAPKVPVS
jgi:hypothetical protein